MKYPLLRWTGLGIMTASSLLLLSGCSSYTHLDAENTPYSVVQTEKVGVFEAPKFSYTDREGQLKPLDVCGKESFFAQTSCSNESGTVSFSYSLNEGNIERASVIFDGTKHSMKCNFDPDDFWSSLHICVPVD